MYGNKLTLDLEFPISDPEEILALCKFIAEKCEIAIKKDEDEKLERESNRKMCRKGKRKTKEEKIEDIEEDILYAQENIHDYTQRIIDNKTKLDQLKSEVVVVEILDGVIEPPIETETTNLCGCGGNNSNKSRHAKTKRHIDFLKDIVEIIN